MECPSLASLGPVWSFPWLAFLWLAFLWLAWLGPVWKRFEASLTPLGRRPNWS
jgi:hypothetical protein